MPKLSLLEHRLRAIRRLREQRRLDQQHITAWRAEALRLQNELRKARTQIDAAEKEYQDFSKRAVDAVFAVEEMQKSFEATVQENNWLKTLRTGYRHSFGGEAPGFEKKLLGESEERRKSSEQELCRLLKTNLAQVGVQIQKWERR